MKLCDACHRHVRPSEGACPFCGRALRTAGAGRLGAVVLLGVLEASCSSRPLEETDSDGPDTSTSTSTSTTGASTTSPTSSTGDAPLPSTTGTATSDATAIASSSGELSSSGDIDTSDSGCSFYGGCPTDFATTRECSVWAQDCPRGEKCMPFSSDGDSEQESTKCVPVARDPDKPGEPCVAEGSGVSGLDSCEVGSMCRDVDPQTLAGECAALCGGSPDAPSCGADQTCVSYLDVVNICEPRCDPLASACAPDEVCVQNPTDPEGLFACVVDASGEGGAQFEACEFINACDPGLACLEPSSASECDPQVSGCCLPFCSLDMPVCTAQGATCVPWFEQGQAPAELADLGVCALPP